ncbi:hypothetical protein GCM10027034_15680 [Ramlibacter solisilvae]|uniref:Uncharacterized protein n=1 Tax=Ramlibacter tataouinensis TaxID=94132 RepID=A0A127JW61_9BURK|nr:hypothetical protein [Ramlibacter tataouinensis]AMO24230.1 hypothetical protein UC35_17030 [Ramlibacter tataouinensis]
MRELARCLAWTLALGALALLLAMLPGAGLEHADGPWAWGLLLAFWPHYLLGPGQGAGSGALHVAAIFGAQFAWFLAVVAAMRRLRRRGKARWRPGRAPQ